MRRRGRRWSPGSGFIKTVEYGDCAVWHKPLEDGCLIAIYMPDWWEDLDSESMPTLWYHVIMQVPRGSWLPVEIQDKTWRWRWAQKYPDPGDPAWTLWGADFLMLERKPPSHKIYHANLDHYRHSRLGPTDDRFKILYFDPERRYAHRGRHGKPFTLPRSVRDSLRPGDKEKRLIRAYQAKAWEEVEKNSDNVDSVSGDTAVTVLGSITGRF